MKRTMITRQGKNPDILDDMITVTNDGAIHIWSATTGAAW
jgi:hypothetical protein